MHLYEIRADLQNALENITIDEETGEIGNMEELEQLQGEFEEKAEAVACYIKDLTAEKEAISEEKKNAAERFESRINSLDNKIDHLKQYLWKNIEATGAKKFETGKVKVTHRITEQLIVDDEFAIPEAYFKVTIPEPVRKVDKVAIKDIIKNGGAVSGTHIQQNNNVTVK